MANLNWESLTSMQIGRYAEYYSKMEFASYGFEVFSSEVDDRGIDFIVRGIAGDFYEIQVKSLRESSKSKYAFIKDNKMDISSTKFIVCFIYFKLNSLPSIYLLKATEWKTPNVVLRQNTGEWGINISKESLIYLENNYRFDKVVGELG